MMLKIYFKCITFFVVVVFPILFLVSRRSFTLVADYLVILVKDIQEIAVSPNKNGAQLPAGQVELSQHRDNFTFSWHYSEFHG